MMSKMLIAAAFLVAGASAQWGGNRGNNPASNNKGQFNHESGRQCFDGIDNDNDGKSDCADPDCEKDRRVRQRCERMERHREHKHDENGKSHETGAQCFDGIDNDHDGTKDCEDPDCQKFRTGRICEEIESLGNQIAHGRKDAESQIPAGCINWFDGCNTCHRTNMNAPLTCGKKRCFRQGQAECRAFDRSYKGTKDNRRHNIRDEWRRGGRNGDIGRQNNGRWSHTRAEGTTGNTGRNIWGNGGN